MVALCEHLSFQTPLVFVYSLEISWQAYLTLKIGEHPGLEIVLRAGRLLGE